MWFARKFRIGSGVERFIALVLLLYFVAVVSILVFKNDVKNFVDNEIITGVLNAVISTIAFFGVLLAIVLQAKELRLQREEIAQTREEFKAQSQTLSLQRFENTFFNLLSLHHVIIEKLSIVVASNSIIGRDAIQHVYTKFKDDFQRRRSEEKETLTWTTKEKHRALARESFGRIYERHEAILSHYLRNLAAIIDFVRSSQLIDSNERKLYFELIRAQLNNYEVVLAFYYFHVGAGFDNWRLFDAPQLGITLNSELLADPDHSFLFDPDHVVKTALAAKDSLG